MTRTAAIITAVALMMLTSIGVSLATSKWGRDKTAQAQRAGCLRNVPRLAATVNATRADLIANRLVASDPTQSKRTREARAAQAAIELRVIETYDRGIDVSSLTTLNSPLDRATVHSEGFRCEVAYPLARLIP